MKRDMDLVRHILLKLNEHEHGYAPKDFSITGYSDEQIGYHCLILGEAGLIKALDITNSGADSPSALPIRLTWDGHEFIENAQNDTIWAQAKDTVSKIGDVSFSVWASVLSQVVLRNLGVSS